MVRTGVAGDRHRGARFQPLLLLGAVLAYLPVAIGHPTDRALLVAVSGAFAAASVAAWWRGRRATSVVVRGWVGLGLALATLVAYVVMLQRADVEVVDLLPFAVLLVTAFALTSASWLRAGLQSVTIAVVAARLVEVQTPTADLVVTVVLLAVVAGVVDVFAVDLARARSAQRRARLGAHRRSRLLTAVGQLLGHSPERASRTTVDTLHGMGFARAEVVTDLRSEVVADLAAVSDASAVDTTWARAGVSVATAGGPAPDADTVVPILVGGAPGGAIRVGRSDHGRLTDEERDVVEVLAAQLGGAWEADVRVARQRELLRRVMELEHTRRGFLDAVSDELHAPLRSVRDAVETLRTPTAVADPHQRDAALATLVRQTDHLGTTIAAVLDVSSVVGAAGGDGPLEPDGRPIVPIAVADLLAPFAGSCDLRGVPSDHLVLVSPELLVHAVDLWLTRSAVDGSATLLVDLDPEGLALRVAVARPGASGEVAAVPARPLVARLLVAAGGRLRDDDTLVLPHPPVERG